LARYRDAVCRLCRREGVKLFLKGQRCLTDKCAIEKRNFAPGQHGKARRPKMVGYGLQLREKQKVRRLYGILEQQFRNYFRKAERKKGVTGEILLQLLETRLDNVIYRLGIVTSRPAARQLVRHGHIEVNGRRVDIPSYQMRVDDIVRVRDKSRNVAVIKQSVENRRRTEMQPWLDFDEKKLEGRLNQIPSRENIPVPIQEQLIVELYSK